MMAAGLSPLKTVTAARMQELDDIAIRQYGIPRVLLMEHAGAALSRAIRELVPPSARVLACCGPGYNGGDGLAAARHLRHAGYDVTVWLAASREQLREEPAVFARMLEPLHVPLREVSATGSLSYAADPAPQLLLDALLGIGASGNVREPAASLIRWMNALAVPIVSADIPSGLDADTGRPCGVAVRASVTVTFGLPKQGCLTPEGASACGRLVVDPITFPPELLRAA